MAMRIAGQRWRGEPCWSRGVENRPSDGGDDDIGVWWVRESHDRFPSVAAGVDDPVHEFASSAHDSGALDDDLAIAAGDLDCGFEQAGGVFKDH